jgi:hypothetical protein
VSIIKKIYKRWLIGCILFITCVHCGATTMLMTDSLEVDSTAELLKEDSAFVSKMIMQDTISMTKRDWNSWRPSAKRAMWLAIVVPGAGQIYNRKYWKLPIFYGGFLGCYYAMRWNNMMYRDYSQGYIDLNDGNLETQSYNQFMHLGMKIDESNPTDVQRFSNKFKKRKDYYRRYRDMSAFILIGVYALSVIDAYVDASLSEFDISEDLSMRVAPTIMRNDCYSLNPVKSTSLGVHCALTF